MASRILALGQKLDQMGWTLTKAIDPVDGSEIIVLGWSEVDGLVKDYEEQILALKNRIGELEGKHG